MLGEILEHQPTGPTANGMKGYAAPIEPPKFDRSQSKFSDQPGNHFTCFGIIARHEYGRLASPILCSMWLITVDAKSLVPYRKSLVPYRKRGCRQLSGRRDDQAKAKPCSLCAAFSSKVGVAEQPFQIPSEPINASSKVPVPFRSATTAW